MNFHRLQYIIFSDFNSYDFGSQKIQFKDTYLH